MLIPTPDNFSGRKKNKINENVLRDMVQSGMGQGQVFTESPSKPAQNNAQGNGWNPPSGSVPNPYGFTNPKKLTRPFVDTAKMPAPVYRDLVQSGSLSGYQVVDSDYLKRKYHDFLTFEKQRLEKGAEDEQRTLQSKKRELETQRIQLNQQISAPDPARSLTEQERWETAGGVRLTQRESQEYSQQLGAIDEQLRYIYDLEEHPENLPWAQALETFRILEESGDYLWLLEMPDFGERSRYESSATGEEPRLDPFSGMYLNTGFEDTLYDYVNGNEKAQGVQMVNDISTGTTHAHFKDLPPEIVNLYNAICDTYGYDKGNQFLNDLLRADVINKQYTGMEGLGYGFIDGLGVMSLATGFAKGGTALFGNEAAGKEIDDFYRGMKKDFQGAQQQHPNLYAAGKIGGTGTLAAATYGLTRAIPGVSGLPGMYQSMALGAGTQGGVTAVQQLGDAATGGLSWPDYAKNVLKQSAYGAAEAGAAHLASKARGTLDNPIWDRETNT